MFLKQTSEELIIFIIVLLQGKPILTMITSMIICGGGGFFFFRKKSVCVNGVSVLKHDTIICLPLCWGIMQKQAELFKRRK